MPSESAPPEDDSSYEYLCALDELGLSMEDAARLFQVEERISERWLDGEETVPRSVRIALWLMLKYKVKPDPIPADTYVPTPPPMLTVNEKLRYGFDRVLKRFGFRSVYEEDPNWRGLVTPRTRAEKRAWERRMQQPPITIYRGSRSPDTSADTSDGAD